jgi:quercetin dioxygenase-like cupin family protein
MKIHLYIIPLFAALVCILCAHHTSPESNILSRGSAGWNGALMESYPIGQPELTVIKAIMPIGMTTPIHKHPNPMAVYVLKGEIEIGDENGNSKQFKQGEVLIPTPDEWHYGRNIGNIPAETITFYAGTVNGAPLRVMKNGD